MVEIIIGMVLMAISLAAASTVLAPVLKASLNANDLAELNNLADNISLEITNDLSQASKVKPITGGISIVKSNQEIRYTVEDGILERNDVAVFSKRYYKRKTIEINYTDADTGGDISDGTGTPVTRNFIVSISILDGVNESIRRDYAIKPLYLNQF